IGVLRPRKGVSRIGVVMRCSWDEEHGLGLVISGDKIESVGDARSVDLAASETGRRKKRGG
ncbi:MAG: DUF6985 domain-containing protein, partial [Isosphaeraceae bacterium]